MAPAPGMIKQIVNRLGSFHDYSTICQDWSNFNVGSLIFAVEKAAFWGMSARTRTHTPKCGGLSWEFLKNQSKRFSGVCREVVLTV